jgi:hypothetical protein
VFDIPLIQVMQEAQDDHSPLLSITREISKQLYLNKHVQLNEEDVQIATELFREEAGFDLSHHHITGILSLYPHARIKLALYGADTEAMGLVMSAFSHFFLGCRWPEYGDVQHDIPGEDKEKLIDMDEFRKALRASAVKMQLALPEVVRG